MEIEFEEMMKYLDYLITDSKINDEQSDLLIKLNNVIVSSLKANDVRNKVHCHAKIKDINTRFEILLNQYNEEKKYLENQLASNILDYGSQRLLFVDNAIENLNNSISSNNIIIEEIIDKHLGYLQSNEQALLNNCLEKLTGSKNYTSFFGTTLISKEKDTFIIDSLSVEKIYSILKNKTEFAKLEQATRLSAKIKTYQEKKEKIDLTIKYYDLIVEDEKIKNIISMLDKKISFISNENDINLTQLIDQRNFYLSIPFGKILFENKIRALSKRIKEYKKQQANANKLYNKKLDNEFKKDKIESFLRRKNLYFLFNSERFNYCFKSKDDLIFEQNVLRTQIQKLEKLLQEIISQFNEEYKNLYFNDKITCNSLVFGLKDNQAKFVSFYILLMLVFTEKIMDSIQITDDTSSQLINSIVEEYFEIQNDKILKMDTEHKKIFSLRKY